MGTTLFDKKQKQTKNKQTNKETNKPTVLNVRTYCSFSHQNYQDNCHVRHTSRMLVYTDQSHI